MKKIIFFGNNIHTTLRFRGNTMKYLVDKEYDLRIVAPESNSNETIRSIAPISTINFSQRGKSTVELLRATIQFVFIIRRYRPDYVFCYGIKCSVISALATILLRTKNITFLTGLGFIFSESFKFSILRRAVIKFINLFATRIVVINKDDELLIRRMISPQKLMLLPGEGIDTAEFIYEEPVLQLCDIDFLYLGRFELDKGFNAFCDAVIQLSKEGFQVKAAVAGGGSQIGYFKNLDFSGTEQNLIFENLNYVSDVGALLSKTKFLVLPSPREGIPRSIMEAMSIGTVCIGTDVPGIRELVLHDKTGFLFPNNDTESVKIAMKNAMNTTLERYREIAKSARQHVQENFRQEQVDIAYIEMLENIN